MHNTSEVAHENQVDNRLQVEWQERWDGSEKKERLTCLGRAMFKAKNSALRMVLPGLDAKTVLEVGCGLGHIMEVYQQAGLNVLGIDISPSAVAVCRRKGLRAELKDIREETSSYDLVSSDGLLEHLLNFESLALCMMQAARRYVLLIQPNHESLTGKTLVYLAEILRGKANVHEYNYRMRDFQEVFAKNGFELTLNQPVFKDVFRLLLFTRQTEATQSQGEQTIKKEN